MPEVNLRRVDLNLLVALNALLEEQHVTRAAERVGMSQSAMSRALSRLRYTFQDPLFVRTSEGMTATKRARELTAPIQELLANIEILVQPQTFDPSTANETFCIHTRDYVAATFLQRVIEETSNSAPGVCLLIDTLYRNHCCPVNFTPKKFVDHRSGD